MSRGKAWIAVYDRAFEMVFETDEGIRSFFARHNRLREELAHAGVDKPFIKRVETVPYVPPVRTSEVHKTRALELLTKHGAKEHTFA